jgi:hypothetical protein
MDGLNINMGMNNHSPDMDGLNINIGANNYSHVQD